MRGNAGFIAIFIGLYAAQGITGSLVQTGLPTALRASGARLDVLGMLALLFLPWALKFLWAPLVDRHWIARLGRRRSWIVPCQLLLVGCFALAAFLPPQAMWWPLLGVLFVVAVLAATQDTATDALAIETLTGPRRHIAGSTQVGGGYLGFVIATALFLPLYAAAGWSVAMLALAAALLGLSLPMLLAPRALEAASSAEERPRASLKAALTRRPFLRSLVFMLVFQAGARIGIALMGPYLVDAGLPLATIGWLKGIGGAVAGLVGALLGSLLLRRIDARRTLGGVAAVHAMTFAALAAAAVLNVRDPVLLAALVLAEGCAMSVTFVALYTTMMSWCAPDQPATDFALLQSADAVLAIAASMAAGALGHGVGHGANFAVAALLLGIAAIAALHFLPTDHATASGTPPLAMRNSESLT